jgi:hypothetical protein
MSRHAVHSCLRSTTCLTSWLKGAGHIDANPFLAVNAYYKKKGVMPVLRADDRIARRSSARSQPCTSTPTSMAGTELRKLPL